MRYACPSCGLWVRPLVEVDCVCCTRCVVYARREEEDQDPLFTEPEAPSEDRRGGG